MRDSIFKASLRLFFLTIGTVLGVFAAIFLIFTLTGSLSDTIEGNPEIAYKYDPKIVPNAQNVRKSLSEKDPVILKINIQNEIGTETLNKKTIEALLVESRERAFKDDRVKAIILNLNTPGGTVTDANAIYQLLKDYKKQYNTPIYAYVDGLCASGGMYIACAADKIYTSDTSLIGSVGVILGPFVNVYKLMDTYGVKSTTFTAGKDKDEMNPLREWAPNEGKNFKELTDTFYSHFIEVVSTARPQVTADKLRDEYGANIFAAAEAEKMGLTDGSNYTFNQALALLAKEIQAEENGYQVVEFESNNWLSSLFKGQAEWSLLSGKISHKLELPPQFDPTFMNQPLYLYRP